MQQMIHNFLPRYFGFMEYTDYIKINVKAVEPNSVDNTLRMAKGFGKKCVATNIDSKELYEFAKKFNFDMFEGPYIAEASVVKANKVHYLQSNSLYFCTIFCANGCTITLSSIWITSSSALNIFGISIERYTCYHLLLPDYA